MPACVAAVEQQRIGSRAATHLLPIMCQLRGRAAYDGCAGHVSSKRCGTSPSDAQLFLRSHCRPTGESWTMRFRQVGLKPRPYAELLLRAGMDPQGRLGAIPLDAHHRRHREVLPSHFGSLGALAHRFRRHPDLSRDPVMAAWWVWIAAWRSRLPCPAASCCVLLDFVPAKLSDCADCSSVWPERSAVLHRRARTKLAIARLRAVTQIAAVTGWKRPPPMWRAASTPSASRT